MKIAFVLYDRMTFLDFFGFYDPITRLNKTSLEISWDICALKEEIKDDRGMVIKANCVGESLGYYDMIFIPGGIGTRQLMYDDIFLSWIKTSKNVKLKISVCTGSLLLGAAGFLKDKKATTHPCAYNLLKPFCKEVLTSRIVDQGDVITARGVSTSLQLGLYICEKLTNKEIMKKIAKDMDYSLSK